jgi:hypothetical protein
MPDLAVSGTVTDRGQAATRIVLLNILVTQYREGRPVSHVYEANVTTGGSGTFSWTVNVRSRSRATSP